MIKLNIAPFIKPQKQKKLLMKVTLMVHLNQYIVQLYQTYKNHLEKVRVGLLIQLQIPKIIFQSTIPYSPAAVGVEYGKYAGNLKLLQEVTAQFEVSKKIGCQKKL